MNPLQDLTSILSLRLALVSDYAEIASLPKQDFALGVLREGTFPRALRNTLEMVSVRIARCSKSLWGKTMLPRFASLGMTIVAAMTLLILGAAYTSLYSFRTEVASPERPMPRSTPSPAHAASSTGTDVSHIYSGAHIIVVCSELEETKKPQTNCP